jgi:prepilin-type N-terminal cleavage/methylation domain-containing protein
MHNKVTAKNGFTLIEVMISVVIISTVIMALIKMFANNTHIFSILKTKTQINQYASFFISNPKVGLENTTALTLYDLVSDFSLEDDLRKRLKEKKIKIVYQEVETIDMSDFDESKEQNSEEKNVNSNMIFEIGKTILNVNNSSLALLRLKTEKN